MIDRKMISEWFSKMAKKRHAKLTKEQRTINAKKMANARWERYYKNKKQKDAN